ncbi:MAG: class I SAM-dependent RNA methyltransferase [Candidatus Sulfopaludibacter sp.]|nr:class I SAM-dependent RNA methyltransferase [Candidatus Sulfopaludibacter sp.]
MFSWLGKEVTPIVRNFEVTVEKLVYGGDGLARQDGRVVLAPYLLPGERASVQAEREKPGLVRAATRNVIEPSNVRVPAPCPVFGRCGGCHYQHAPYDYQVEAKCAILVEELRRLGKIEPPEEISVVSGEPWGYRNRVQLQVERGRLGYREARSHKLCAIRSCPIASPKINETVAALLAMLADSRWPNFVESLEIFSDEQQVQLNVLETRRPVSRRFFEWCAETIPGMVPGALDWESRFRVSRNSFFQVNRFLVDKLVETALDFEGGGETALDLYAGVGLFSLALARRFGQVTAVDSGSGAVRDLEFNAQRAGLANVRTERDSTEAYLEKLEAAPDYVLLDPPRAGLGKVTVRRLLELKPRRMTIVACDPATLARDLAALTSGGYRMEKMTMVDLFPQTYHIETVVQLAITG